MSRVLKVVVLVAVFSNFSTAHAQVTLLGDTVTSPGYPDQIRFFAVFHCGRFELRECDATARRAASTYNATTRP